MVGISTDLGIEIGRRGGGSVPIEYADIAFVGSGTFGGFGTFAFSSLLNEAGATPTVEAGDLVLVEHTCVATTGRTLVAPTGYTEAHVQVGSGLECSIMFQSSYKIMEATPDASVVINNPGGTTWNAVTIHVFRNVDPTTPMDVAAIATSGNGTGIPNPPAITPTTVGAAIVAAGGAGRNGGASVHTNPPGFSTGVNHFRTIAVNATLDASTGTGVLFGWESGTVDPTMGGTEGTDFGWVAATLALRPKII